MRPRYLVPLALCVLAVLGGDACKAQDDQPLQILRVLPPAVGSAGACGGGTEFISTGVLDLTLVRLFDRGYVLFPVVLNRELSNTASNGGVESNRVTVTGADVDLCFDDACSAMFGLAQNGQHFRQILYVVIDPQGQATIPVDLIRATTAQKIATANAGDVTALVTLKMVGTSNENTVRSNSMKFAIRICTSCLVNDIGACCRPALNVGLCNPVQDAVIDCCKDSSGATICPARQIGPASCTASDAGAP